MSAWAKTEEGQAKLKSRNKPDPDLLAEKQRALWQDEEHLAKMRKRDEENRARWATPEYRAKMAKRKKPPAHTMFQKGQVPHNAVKVVRVSDGTVFESVSAAAASVGGRSPYRVTQCCKGLRKDYMKHEWRFFDADKEIAD